MSNYLEQVHAVLPWALAQMDRDPASPSRGVADRMYWAWKTIDFANGTNQGLANGLARLASARLLPDFLPANAAVRRVMALSSAARRLTRADGSLEEALPYESSFCVTALVAFDVLTAYECLAKIAPEGERKKLLEVVAPWVEFLCDEDETHALISNHLATAAAALLKWARATGGADRSRVRAHTILERLRRAQSNEGWLPEYEGPDPGYLSLALYYLADIALAEPALRPAVLPDLTRLVEFLALAAHPDGSFGGWYGSRNTRFLVPAGFEALAPEIPTAAALARFARRSVTELRVPPLQSIDAGNFAPFFNAWAWAAALSDAAGAAPEPPLLPHLGAPFRCELPEAGWLVERGPRHYTIVNARKGGVVQHYAADARPLIDAGAVAVDSAGRAFSTQGPAEDTTWTLDARALVVRARLSRLRHQVPTPFRFIVLRTLSLTLLRWRWFRHWLKRRLVRFLITGRSGLAAWNVRTIWLGEKLEIADAWASPASAVERVRLERPHSAIHMASQGYWQRQDDEE